MKLPLFGKRTRRVTHLEVACLQDVGLRRDHQEDSLLIVDKHAKEATWPDAKAKGSLFVVADGMGGHNAGEVASRIAVDTVYELYYNQPSTNVSECLLYAIEQANGRIHQQAQATLGETGMGTTIVATVVRGDELYVAHAGDSRAYQLRGPSFRQITEDHTWISDQIKLGLIKPEAAATHQQRSVITRALGHLPTIQVDTQSFSLEQGDVILLCSDGLTGPVSNDTIRRALQTYEPSDACEYLVRQANDPGGGPDNITLIIVRIGEVVPVPATSTTAPTPASAACQGQYSHDSTEPQPVIGSGAGSQRPIPTPVQLPEDSGADRASQDRPRKTGQSHVPLQSELGRRAGVSGSAQMEKQTQSPATGPRAVRRRPRKTPKAMLTCLVICIALLAVCVILGAAMWLVADQKARSDSLLENWLPALGKAADQEETILPTPTEIRAADSLSQALSAEFTVEILSPETQKDSRTYQLWDVPTAGSTWIETVLHLDSISTIEPHPPGIVQVLNPREGIVSASGKLVLEPTTALAPTNSYPLRLTWDPPEPREPSEGLTLETHLDPGTGQTVMIFWTVRIQMIEESSSDWQVYIGFEIDSPSSGQESDYLLYPEE